MQQIPRPASHCPTTQASITTIILILYRLSPHLYSVVYPYTRVLTKKTIEYWMLDSVFSLSQWSLQMENNSVFMKNFCSSIKYQQIRSFMKRFLFVTEKNNNKNGCVQICVIGNSGNVLTWWVVTMPHCLIASRQTLANTRHNKQSFISLTRTQLCHLHLLPGFFCGLACFRRPGCEVVALTQVWAAWDGPWAGPTEGWVSGLGEGLVIMSLLRLSMMTTHVGTLVH